MTLLVLKVLLTSTLTAALTLIARSRGSRFAGVVVGLPLTSGPVSAFLAVENGAAFSARAAVGALTGVVGVQAFCTAYAICARRMSWGWALFVGSTVCLGAMALLQFLTFGLGTVVTLAVLTAVVLRSAMERLGLREQTDAGTSVPMDKAPLRWDLPVRVGVATLLVVTLTLCARRLGPSLSGALSGLPILTGVLAAFTQHQAGRNAAIGLLAATVTATLCSVAFFAIVGVLLAPGVLVLTYVTATAVAATMSSLLAWRAPLALRCEAPQTEPSNTNDVRSR